MPSRNVPAFLRLNTDNFTHNMWGGDWIPRLKNLPLPDDPVGESWEFSTHPHNPSRVVMKDGNRPLLADLIRLQPARLIGKRGRSTFGQASPFLVKLIDARDDLSVQVHPSDSYAKRHEKESGKTESWVILGRGTKPGDGWIYIGFDPAKAKQFSTVAAFRQAFRQALDRANDMGPQWNPGVRKKAASFVLPFLNKVRVKPGQVYHLKPGTIHAIGQGVRLFEIQQTSDLTYRVWDWNRPDSQLSTPRRPVPRPLHLKKAFDVLDFESKNPEAFRLKPQRVAVRSTGRVQVEALINSRAGEYAFHRATFQARGSKLEARNNGRFSVVTVLEGEVSLVEGALSSGGERCRVKKGHTIMIPAFLARCHFISETNRAVLIRSFPSV